MGAALLALPVVTAAVGAGRGAETTEAADVGALGLDMGATVCAVDSALLTAGSERLALEPLSRLVLSAAALASDAKRPLPSLFLELLPASLRARVD